MTVYKTSSKLYSYAEFNGEQNKLIHYYNYWVIKCQYRLKLFAKLSIEIISTSMVDEMNFLLKY